MDKLKAWFLALKRRFLYQNIGILVCLLPIFKGDARWQKFQPPGRVNFIHLARFNGDYFADKPIFDIGKTMAHIRQDVPLVHRYKVCEHLYYRIMDKRTVDFEFQYLDAMDQLEASDSMRAFTQMLRGALYNGQQKFDSARIVLAEALDLSIRAERWVRAGDIIKVMGGTAVLQGDYDTAIAYFLQAESYFADLYHVVHEHDRIFTTYMELGGAYKRYGDLEKAVYWLGKALHFTRERRLPSFEADVLLHLSKIYIDSGDWERARTVLSQAQATGKIEKDTFFLAEKYFCEGALALGIGESQTAVGWLRKALAIHPNMMPSAFTAHVYHKLALAFEKLGQEDSVRYYYSQALRWTQPYNKGRIFQDMAYFYERIGAYQQAFTAQDSAYAFFKRQYTLEKDRKIAQLEYKNQAAEKDRALAETILQSRLSMLSAAVLFLVLVLLWVYFSWRTKQLLSDKALKEQELHIMTMQQAVNKQQLATLSADLAEKNDKLYETETLLNLKLGLIDDLEAQLEEVLPPFTTDEATLWSVPSKLRILTTDDWNRFKESFERAFPYFLTGFRRHFPKITPAEERFFLLIKVGFNNQEISQTLGISLESVYKGRYRLRQKLGLGDADDLDTFINDFVPTT